MADSTSRPRVRLLGGATIEQDGRPLSGRVNHRHAVALLALLATAPGRTVSRDRLVALLWPEGEPLSVRHRLNTLLYDLRRVFGAEAITSVNDAVHLDAEQVPLDLLEFRAAAAGGDPERAAACYGGPFLEGFHLPDAAELEHWLSTERDRLAREATAVCGEAATRADAAGRPAQAAEYWRALVRLDPGDAAPVLALMRALDAAGDRRAALRAADQHATRMAEELRSADPRVAELAATLRAPAPGPRSPAPSPQSPLAVPRSPVLWLVLLALIPLGIFGRKLLGGDPEPAAPGRVVVLPFVVRGGERFAWLGEGMVDLLSATLDGAGSLRSADPHAVLSALRADSRDPGDPAAGRRAAARFQAGYYVLGSIVEAGGRLNLRATLYRADGGLEAQGAAEAADDAEVFAMVDALTRQLLAGRYGAGPRQRISRLAVLTSASLPALKAYLAGEAHHRLGARDSALDAFRSAVREDSSFALAWYRLAVAAEWALQPHEAAEAVERAVASAARLPERERLLLVGWRAYARGEADLAEEVYRRVLDSYPDALEAWLQLGEIQFHYAPARGLSIAASRAAFERVLELEPGHEAALVHLARVTALAGDREALARHVARLVAQDPSGPIALEMRALLAGTTGDSAALRDLEAAFRAADSYAVISGLLSQFYVADLAGIAWCARLLAAPERPREVRVAGHLVLALGELARGRVGAALEEVTRAEALDPLRGGELRALLAALPFLPESLARRAGPRPRLGAAAAESFFLPDHDRVRPLLHAWLEGLADPERGVRRLAALPSPPRDSTLAADLALGVRAEAARRAGREPEALALLLQVRELPGYQLVLPAPFDPRARERWLRAELLERAGRVSEARRAYAGIGARSLYDLAYLAPALHRLANLDRRLGDTAQAERRMREFGELWRNADPALRQLFP